VVDLAALKAELARSGRLSLTVKAIPKASRTEIAGILEDGSLKVKVAAVPEKGKANAAICEFLAREFAVAKQDVVVVRGATSSTKLIRITSRRTT
jgi:uncharacterized protein